jgi:hypothetical protein
MVAGKKEMTPLIAAGTAKKTGGTAAEPKTCHPSVCVGDAKPTSCICPTSKEK